MLNIHLYTQKSEGPYTAYIPLSLFGREFVCLALICVKKGRRDIWPHPPDSRTFSRAISRSIVFSLTSLHLSTFRNRSQGLSYLLRKHYGVSSKNRCRSIKIRSFKGLPDSDSSNSNDPFSSHPPTHPLLQMCVYLQSWISRPL